MSPNNSYHHIPDSQAVAVKAPVQQEVVSPLSKLTMSSAPIMVLLSNDLRMDDHPGLTAAAAAATASKVAVVPLLVLDPAKLWHLLHAPAGPEAWLDAAARLRQDLQRAGSDLVLRIAPTATAAAEVASAVGAGVIIQRSHVEGQLQQPFSEIQTAVEAAGGKLAFGCFSWGGPVDGIYGAQHFDSNYRVWVECRGLPSPSLPSPYALPSLPSNLTPGTLPTPSQLRELLTEAARGQLLRQDPSGKVLEMSQSVWATCADPRNTSYRRSARFSAAALEHGALPLLRAYLNLPSLPASSPFAFLREEESSLATPAAAGVTFQTLFGPLMTLGVLSHRTVHQEARAYRDVAYLGVATPEVAAALRAAECADFHQQLSHRDEGRPLEGGVAVGHWTWGGALTGKREATLLAART
ncbi:MAG: hypothetical protein WDW38_001201 [Sanguina aurantia]